MIGPLTPKNIFSDAKLLLKDELLGPESIVFYNDAVYVTDHSGLVKIVDGKKVKTVSLCCEFYFIFSNFFCIVAEIDKFVCPFANSFFSELFLFFQLLNGGNCDKKQIV